MAEPLSALIDNGHEAIRQRMEADRKEIAKLKKENERLKRLIEQKKSKILKLIHEREFE